jgi:hypothetical protein
MVFSSLYSGQFKLDPADIQRTAIAGGVSMSSLVSIFATPWQVGPVLCSTVSLVVPRGAPSASR